MNIARANKEFTEVVNITNVPVVTTIMGRGAVPTDHPLFIGNLGMHGAYAANMAVSECDLLFSIGTRFNDRITGKLHEFAPNAQIVHIDIDTASISRNIHVHVPIVADAKEAVAKMREYVEPCETKEWLERIAQWNAEHPLTMKVHGSIGPRDIIEEMNRQFDDAIITTSDVCDAVCRNNGKEAARYIRRTRNYGIWIPRCDRSEDRQSGQNRDRDFR